MPFLFLRMINPEGMRGAASAQCKVSIASFNVANYDMVAISSSR
jgi:hypothetical protein